jgi:hypothetical protein
MLKKLNISELKVLRELYHVNFPTSAPTIGLLDHFIDRFQNHPEWQDKVEFVALDDSCFKDGTFTMLYGQIFQFNTIAESPFTNLQKLMYSFDFNQYEDYKFWTVYEKFDEFVDELIERKKLEKAFVERTVCRVTNFNKDEAIKKLKE